MNSPSISVVVAAYNAERHIATTLEALVAQTHPPQEIIVVDDGSSDGTQLALRPFKSKIRVVRQANRGHPGAYNTGFEEARGDYVARCDADDIWEPTKLERQVAALMAHPEIDIAFCGAEFFGLIEGQYAPHPGAGLLDRREFAERLFRANLVCSSTTLIRRRLYERLGPFVERLPCEDYDYWMRALESGAVFFYDPTALVRYRRHEQQVTHDLLPMQRATHKVHVWHRQLPADRSLAEQVLARDLFRIGRSLVEGGRPREARNAFRASLRHRLTLRGLGWALVLSVPECFRQTLIDVSLALKRALPASEVATG